MKMGRRQPHSIVLSVDAPLPVLHNKRLGIQAHQVSIGTSSCVPPVRTSPAAETLARRHRRRQFDRCHPRPLHIHRTHTLTRKGASIRRQRAAPPPDTAQGWTSTPCVASSGGPHALPSLVDFVGMRTLRRASREGIATGVRVHCLGMMPPTSSSPPNPPPV